MTLLARFVEEIHLGVVEDPHTRRSVVLTEKVTVCPSCNCFHSLRHHDMTIRCAACDWSTPASDATFSDS